MSKEIQLTQGFVTLVDDEDFEELTRWGWRAVTDSKANRRVYAMRSFRAYTDGPSIYIPMHRQILRIPIGSQLNGDHIDGNTLDNRRANLRIATPKQNAYNRRTIREGYKGVYVKGQSWGAQIKINGKNTRLGAYSTPEDAASAYDFYARQHYGEFAYLNFPNEPPRLPEKNPSRTRTLTAKQVRQIRKLREETGMSYREIGEIVGVSASQAQKIGRGLLYRRIS